MKNDSLKHKEIRFYTTWDLKSIAMSIVTLAILGFILYIYFRPSGDDMERDKDYYNAYTKGVVYGIDRKIGMLQGRTGNSETTIGYEIKYYYDVNGKIYYNSDLMNDNNNDFIIFVNENLNKDSFIVRYVSWKPEDCFLVKTLDKNKNK